MTEPRKRDTEPAGASVEQVAALLNLTGRRVQQLAKEGVMPRPTRGVYNLPACVRAYVAYLQRKLETAHADAIRPTDLNFVEAKNRKLGAEATIAEMERDAMAGKFVSVDEFRLTVRQIATTLRAQLMAVPGRMAARTVGLSSLPESQQAWDGAVRDILAELQE